MRCKSLVVTAALATVSAAALGGGAFAQSTAGQTAPLVPVDDLFNRSRDVGVLDRTHPDYSPKGLPLGAFRAYPVLEIEGAHNSNVLAPAYPAPPQGDFYGVINPQIDIQSQWSRNLIKLDGSYSDAGYANLTSENGDQYYGSAEGRFDIGRNSYVGAIAKYTHSIEPRTDSGSPEFAAFPVRFDVSNYGGYWAFEANRLLLSGRADYLHIVYHDVAKLAVDKTTGLPIDHEIDGVIPQFQRNRNVWNLQERAEYALSPATALVLQGNYMWAQYPFNPVTQAFNPLCLTPHACNQDNHGFNIQGGVNFEATTLVRGEVTFGYLSQTYKGSAFPAFSGIAYAGQLEFFPSELTTITLSTARTPEQSALPGTGGYIQQRTDVRVDHELLRNMTISAGAWYAHDVYQDITRRENFVTAYLRDNWYVNRNMRLEFRYDHFKHRFSGDGFGRNYDVDLFTMGVHFQE
jgi:hypothetical protein